MPKKLSKIYEEFINRKVKAEMKKLKKLAEEEASRETYKDRIEESISGAIGEFYKARIAQKNGEIKWVNHWYGESDRLIRRELSDKIVGHVNCKNRYLAIKEACDYIKGQDKFRRNRALSIVEEDFNKKMRLVIEDNDTDDFWNMVDMTINNTLTNFNLK
jgi:hypothetical protein